MEFRSKFAGPDGRSNDDILALNATCSISMISNRYWHISLLRREVWAIRSHGILRWSLPLRLLVKKPPHVQPVGFLMFPGHTTSIVLRHETFQTVSITAFNPFSASLRQKTYLAYQENTRTPTQVRENRLCPWHCALIVCFWLLGLWSCYQNHDDSLGDFRVI